MIPKSRVYEHIDQLISSASASFELSEGGDALAALYASLVERTIIAAVDYDHGWMNLRETPWSSFFYLSQWHTALLTNSAMRSSTTLQDLVGEWWGYVYMYYELRDRSPLLELRDHQAQISECINRSGWNEWVEEPLRDWVDQGADLANLPYRPFDPSDVYLTPKIAGRLSTIRRVTRGWVYGYRGGDVFLTDHQVNRVPRGPGPEFEAYMAEAKATRPSFEGL